ncbi:MAG: hypothetical protein WC378_07360 [Opitutaceae bacterium]|jgi:hypothetical protein
MQKCTPHIELSQDMIQHFLETAAVQLAAEHEKPAESGRRGATLRPGTRTPLWNILREHMKPHLKEHGAQARLGRLLGLHRQAVNAYFTRGSRMPDAERTLLLLAWLMAKHGDGA